MGRTTARTSFLLHAVDVWSCKEEYLPVAISHDNKEPLIAVPKLEDSLGCEKIQALWNALVDRAATKLYQ